MGALQPPLCKGRWLPPGSRRGCFPLPFVGRDDHGAPPPEGHYPCRRSNGKAPQFYKCQGERLSGYGGRDDAYYLCAGYRRR